MNEYEIIEVKERKERGVNLLYENGPEWTKLSGKKRGFGEEIIIYYVIFLKARRALNKL